MSRNRNPQCEFNIISINGFYTPLFRSLLLEHPQFSKSIPNAQLSSYVGTEPIRCIWTLINSLESHWKHIEVILKTLKILKTYWKYIETALKHIKPYQALTKIPLKTLKTLNTLKSLEQHLANLRLKTIYGGFLSKVYVWNAP